MAGYLGSTPVPQATQHRESFTCTEGQTSFATAGYTPQFLDVFLNGSHLSPADFVATNSSDVVLVVAASADDVCDIISYTPFEVADQTFTGTTTMDVVAIGGATTIATDKKLIFRDSAIHISSTADGDLSIAADDEIDITSTLIDINGAVDMSSTLATASTITVTTAASTKAGSFVGNGIEVKHPTGASNLFIGTQSGNDVKIACIGAQSMRFDTNGVERLNIAADGAISTPTAGTSNVRFGVNAGDSIVSGANENVLIGDEAGTSLVEHGINNTAVGFSALKFEDTHGYNTAIGWSTLKNLNAGANGYNTAVGADAGRAVTTGTFCTYIGAEVGNANSDGVGNVAVGGGATYAALGTDTRGKFSTAVGFGALTVQNFTSVTDSGNTAVGYFAGGTLSVGTGNCYIGSYAGDDSNDGANNVAVGLAALSGNHGNNNVAVGEGAMIAGTGGTNTVVGSGACGGSFTASGTTAMGRSAGAGIAGGNNNICLGNGADVAASGQVNGICIGVGITAAANDFSFGKASNVVTNDFDSDANWSRSSDQRLKKNITNQTLGLDFINDLRTVKYNWKASNELDSTDAQLAHLYKEDAADNEMNTDAVMHNFIAQEVKAALDTAGVSGFGGWKEDHHGVQQVSREMFVIPLVKAVQELSTALDAALARIATLEG